MTRSISFKLIGAVGLAVILIISIFSFIILRSHSEVLLDEMERHTLQLSDAVKNGTKYDMLLNHRDHILESIKQTGKPECIQSVRIFNKSGEIIYAADTSQIGNMVDKKAEACFACHAENEPIQKLSISDRTRIFKMHPDAPNVMGVINPIYNDRSCWDADCHAHTQDKTVLGVLDITVCLKSYDESMAESKIKMLEFALIAIILLGAIIWFFVRYLVFKPVKELVYATKTIASGNLNYRISRVGDDELGALARSFNHMTQKLSEARMQLFHSDKMASLGRLAAGVAHEINNPLTGILTYSSYLLKHTKNKPELQNDLAVIVRETKRSRDIVKGLLDFARQSVPKKNLADIHEIIDRAVGVIENQLSLSHIKLIQNFADALPKIKVDSNQIQQVFINLIENAAYAVGKKGGTISVEIEDTRIDPYGFAQIKGATCAKGHDLIDPSVKIDGMPSIKVKARVDETEGIINLHPIYGKNQNHRYGIEIQDKREIDISCPVCSGSLMETGRKCPKCNAAVFFLEISSKGRMQGCSRKGCDWQEWMTLEKEGQKEFIKIRVKDTGSGISQEHLDKIFDPFFTTKGQKGTGLGLAVIWGIIDNHNGHIEVDSIQGEGTTFTIMLPV